MKRIIIIDDDADMRALLRMALEKSGYEVIDLEGGLNLMTYLENQPVDLVITDIFMPDKNGMEIIKECREFSKDLKIIAITAGGDLVPGEFLKEPAKRIGANHTLSKPFDYKEIIDVVKSLIGE